jgi:hypothetical protein
MCTPRVESMEMRSRLLVLRDIKILYRCYSSMVLIKQRPLFPLSDSFKVDEGYKSYSLESICA